MKRNKNRIKSLRVSSILYFNLIEDDDDERRMRISTVPVHGVRARSARVLSYPQISL